MMTSILLRGTVAVFIAVWLPYAMGKTVDTFRFSQSGFATGGLSGGISFISAGPLSGTFTATVEPDGRISLADLTAFQAQLPGQLFPNSKAVSFSTITQPHFFSFNKNGGVSTLSFAVFVTDDARTIGRATT